MAALREDLPQAESNPAGLNERTLWKVPSEIDKRLGRAARWALTGPEEAALFGALQKRVAPRINISSLVCCIYNEQGLFYAIKRHKSSEIKNQAKA
ncbi:hypothetical protein QS257_08300 [Terrilactibacillus sp. S3-3]|nr:hypothetical protein QS257_08300 [Terrilactibacillus sp. S3-3]